MMKGAEVVVRQSTDLPGSIHEAGHKRIGDRGAITLFENSLLKKQ
jgi:hypothetical protein